MAIGADDQLEQLGRQLVRAAGDAADDEGRVLAAVTGLIGQRALIPIIDATGGLPKGELTRVSVTAGAPCSSPSNRSSVISATTGP